MFEAAPNVKQISTTNVSVFCLGHTAANAGPPVGLVMYHKIIPVPVADNAHLNLCMPPCGSGLGMCVRGVEVCAWVPMQSKHPSALYIPLMQPLLIRQ
jgi:hypothetical protein